MKPKTYNYLVFQLPTGKRLKYFNFIPKTVVGRATSISQVIGIVESSELKNYNLTILRFNQLEIASISRVKGKWVVKSLEHFPKDSSQQLYYDFIDQKVVQEIGLATINMFNSIKLKSFDVIRYSFGILKRDESQSVRIIRNQLEMIYGVKTEETKLVKLLKLWWKALQEHG